MAVSESLGSETGIALLLLPSFGQSHRTHLDSREGELQHHLSMKVMSNNLWPSLIFHIWSAVEEFLLFCLIPSLQRIISMNEGKWQRLGKWVQKSLFLEFLVILAVASPQLVIKSSQKGWLISFYWCMSDSSFYCCSIREEMSLVPSLLWRVCQFLTFI